MKTNSNYSLVIIEHFHLLLFSFDYFSYFIVFVLFLFYINIIYIFFSVESPHACPWWITSHLLIQLEVSPQILAPSVGLCSWKAVVYSSDVRFNQLVLPVRMRVMTPMLYMLDQKPAICKWYVRVLFLQILLAFSIVLTF